MRTESKMLSAVKWRIVMYSPNEKWMKFVCAIDAGKHNVFLRFLDGTQMKDSAGKFRYGRATMAMWDIGFNEPFDEKLVARYVSEAMAIRIKTERTESSVSQLHGMGPNSMKLLKAAMKSKKVAFKR